ncbi:MAG: hypothetical protein JXQ80_01730 [Bacteroidales bacterium]|nr:hypothetical protein [Bacteroidales bacterium]
MKTPTINQLEIRRYRLVMYATLYWALWFGLFIVKELFTKTNLALDFIQAIIGMVSLVLLAIVLTKYIRLSSKIKNSRFNEALNNELFQLYRNKSLIWGFWSFTFCLLALLLLSYLSDISAKLACLITLYTGVLTSLVAGLIYNYNTSDDNKTYE